MPASFLVVVFTNPAGVMASQYFLYLRFPAISNHHFYLMMLGIYENLLLRYSDGDKILSCVFYRSIGFVTAGYSRSHDSAYRFVDYRLL